MKKNILTTEQASFLKQYNFSLYQERFEVLCKAQKAEKDGHLNLPRTMNIKHLLML